MANLSTKTLSDQGYKGDKGEYDEQELVRQRERSAEETEDK